MDALYTAVATATHGREGRAVTSDGKLDLGLSAPKELGGDGKGTNPEQLFAAGYAACFASAMGVVARQEKIDISEASVTAEVSIGKDAADGGFGLALLEKTHAFCPYSKATRGNIKVDLVVE